MKKLVLLLLFLLIIPPVKNVAAIAAENGDLAVVLSKTHKERGYQVALFAGGCFWCLEPPFEKLHGVIDASVGYCGGKQKTASYYEVSGGSTNHLETVRVVYDPQQVSYKELLDIYWRFIDPTDAEGQYDDRGHQYSTVIFYQNDLQRKIAENSKKALVNSAQYSKPVVTEILPVAPFYLAEERHQNFYEKRFPSSQPFQREK